MQILNDNGEILTYDKLSVERLAYEKTDLYQKSNLSTDIPTTFEEFYKDFGPLQHDYNRDKKTNLPVTVNRLTPYQNHFAKLDYGFALKGNKMGMTTSEMLCDFWTRLLPQYAGFDCLLCASKLEIANDLLMQLKTLVNNSDKYSQYLIKSPESMDFKEEKSKVGVMYVANPYNPKRKSRIIAIGNSPTSVYSRMRVNRIHITDPSRLIIRNQSDYFSGLFSRISNTGGQIKIEGVPGKENTGWFYKMSKAFGYVDADPLTDNQTNTHLWDEEDSEYEIPKSITKIFSHVKLTIDDAVEYGVIPPHVRKFLQDTLSPAEYRRTCMAEFPPPQNAALSKADEGTHAPEDW